MKKHIPIFSPIVALLLAACTQPIRPIASSTEVADAEDGMKVVSLDQGWDEKTQLAFWFTDQGSRIMPYQWFLALEQAGDADLLRSGKNILRLGYLPAKPGPGRWNPDGLPIGFAKNVDKSGAEWMGLTCAACHTAQVNYKEIGIRIDGGPAMADFNTFYADVIASLTATLDDNDKFDRFTRRVLGNSSTPAQRSELHASLAQAQTQNEVRYKLNQPGHEPGYARLDAFGNIFNEVLVTALHQPGNAKPPDAPVSYPFLWDTPQHNVVQWNGSAPNGPAGIGGLARNTGEVVGVFGGLSIDDCGAKTCRYPSSVNLPNLGKLESWLRSLWSPQWDARYLGAIDTALSVAGKAHYEKYCLECHANIKRTDPNRTITAVMHDVGTDPGMATAALSRSAVTGPLQGKTKSLFPLRRFGATDAGSTLLDNGVVGILLDNFGDTLLALYFEYGDIEGWRTRGAKRTLDKKPSPDEIRQALSQYAGNRHQILRSRGLPAKAGQPVEDATYKARPLNGIWATAPYLHNGSVPNLWELLQEPGKRVTSFYVGSRELDPENVGFVSDSGPYKLDVSLPGNSNSGHPFGAKELNDTQKRELIEYLKTL